HEGRAHAVGEPGARRRGAQEEAERHERAEGPAGTANQNVTDGWWTPNTPRSRSQISPSVTCASTACTMRATRFSFPRAATAIAFRPNARDLLGERVPHGGVDLEEVGGRRLVREVLVDAHDDAGPLLHLALVPVRRVLDLALHERDRGDRTPELVDLPDVGARRLLDLVRQPLEGERSAEGIDDVRHARLVGEDLLGPERDAHGALGRE